MPPAPTRSPRGRGPAEAGPAYLLTNGGFGMQCVVSDRALSKV